MKDYFYKRCRIRCLEYPVIRMLFGKKNLFFLFVFLGLSLDVLAQGTISGTVKDEAGNVLSGVSIQLKGTTIRTSTDNEGKYVIVSSDPQVTLIFTYIGFVRKEELVNGRNKVDVTLSHNNQFLDEVVITGYSSQRKGDITGSVAVVDMKALKSVPSASAMQALQGQASGVNVINSGVPGAASKILIRGVSSFGNTQPLVLVDGVQANLNTISADDIESIQVLKDAGAAAIYGVRGSNGVIVVTTRKGKQGAPVFSYDGYFGVELPLSGNPYNMLNSKDFEKIVNIGIPNNGLFVNGMPDYLYGGPGVSGVAMEGDPAIDPSKYKFDPIKTKDNYVIQKVNKVGTNWFQELFDPALSTNHHLTASGGTEKSNYLFSLGVINQEGTLIETYLKRYSARINTMYKVNENIRIGENVNIFYIDNPSFREQYEFGPTSDVYKMFPIIPVYDINGNFGGTYAGPDLGGYSNPVAEQRFTVNDRHHSWNAIGNIYAEVDFLKHFTLRTSMGGTLVSTYNQDFKFTRYYNKQGYNEPNTYSEGGAYNNSTIWTNTITYSNKLEKHTVKLLLGSEAITNSARSVSGSAQDFFSTDFNYLILGNGTSGITNRSGSSMNALFSVFGRLDYDYQNKYLIAATLRRDGSSKFGSMNRFGVFPSFSLGWRISNEAFMENVDWVNDFKLRGSYGVLGSEINVSPDNAFSLYGGGYGTTYYDITGTGNSVVQGFAQTRIGNPNAGWEENVISNIGLDASLLQNRLNISAEYYKKSINGLLFAQPLPATVGGATAPTVNIGDVQNKGFDVSLTYNGKFNNNLQYSIGINGTSYKNTIRNIPDPGYFDVGGLQGWGAITRNQEGFEASSFYGYKVIGLFNSDDEVAASPGQTGAAPGRFKYMDVNNDNVITPDDRAFLGSANPDFTYGVNLSLNYKNFDLSAMLYGSQGNEIVNTIRYYTDFFGGYFSNMSNNVLDAWTPQNTDTSVPIIENGVSLSTNGAFNSYFVEDGSFMKLKSLMVGYELESDFLHIMKISSLRLYTQAVNLFTLTKYTGLDSEVGGSNSSFGIDLGHYPTSQRKFLFGLSITF